MADALSPITYSEVFELRRQFRLLYGNTLALDYLLAAAAPTGAQLEAWLATDANLVAYQRLIATAVGASALCMNTGAVAAVVGSATALAYLRDSDTGRAAMLNSKPAMVAVLASATAPGVLLVSGTARAAIYDNETAWSLWAASANGRSALSAIAVEHSTNVAGFVYPAGLSGTTRAVLVQQKATGGGSVSYAGALADTYTTSSSVYIDRYARVTGLAHRATSTAVSSQIRFVLMQG